MLLLQFYQVLNNAASFALNHLVPCQAPLNHFIEVISSVKYDLSFLFSFFFWLNIIEASAEQDFWNTADLSRYDRF